MSVKKHIGLEDFKKIVKRFFIEIGTYNRVTQPTTVKINGNEVKSFNQCIKLWHDCFDHSYSMPSHETVINHTWNLFVDICSSDIENGANLLGVEKETLRANSFASLLFCKFVDEVLMPIYGEHWGRLIRSEMDYFYSNLDGFDPEPYKKLWALIKHYDLIDGKEEEY